MTDLSQRLARISGVHETIGEALGKFGGIVRCETCRTQWDIDAEKAGRYTAKGWPRCCGYSMRWWTQVQIDAGEVPA